MRIEYFSLCMFVKSLEIQKQSLAIILEDMAQRVWNRISNEHRHRIVRAFEEEMKDYLLVADTLGINRPTARSSIATYVRQGRIEARPCGGRNNV